MKKYLCALLAIIMLFSFTACTPKVENDAPPIEETTSAYPTPTVGDRTLREEFKDENGNVVFVVEGCFPAFTDNYIGDNNIILDIYYDSVFEEACDFAKSNIKNAAKYISDFSSENPWSRKFSYELKFIDPRFVSVILYDEFSMSGKSTTPTVTTQCFDIFNFGSFCSIFDFAFVEDDPDTFNYLIDCIFSQAENTFFTVVDKQLDDDDKQAMRECFDPFNFYFTDEVVGFCFRANDINQDGSGNFFCEVPWQELLIYFDTPMNITESSTSEAENTD